MACPDELTLDLWLAEVLPPDEAAAIAAHVSGCAACSVARQALNGLSAELHAALALDADEQAYITGLGLAANWRKRAQPTVAWGWIVLAGAVSAFAAWLVAAPALGGLVASAIQIGAGTVVLNVALGLLFSLGEALFEASRNPAVGLSQPLLALLALALLAWPRQLISNRSTHA